MIRPGALSGHAPRACHSPLRPVVCCPPGLPSVRSNSPARPVRSANLFFIRFCRAKTFEATGWPVAVRPASPAKQNCFLSGFVVPASQPFYQAPPGGPGGARGRRSAGSVARSPVSGPLVGPLSPSLICSVAGAAAAAPVLGLPAAAAGPPASWMIMNPGEKLLEMLFTRNLWYN